MTILAQQARSYLEAGGFWLVRERAGALHLQRESRGKSEHILLWCDEEADSNGRDSSVRRRRETDLLCNFEREMRAAPRAVGYYLVDRRLGLSQNFVTEATRLLGSSGGIRVPAEFFDTAYKIDCAEARRARSAIGDVIALFEKVRRVAQPCSVRSSLAPGSRRDLHHDLVEYLETSLLHANPLPKLHLIDGAAGSGKTVAFNALVAALHRGFIAAKRARQDLLRPIVFLPQHLRGKSIGYVDDILAAVADTDVADLTSPDQFKWLLKHGRSLWMFDGLDEFYGGSPDFLSFLEEALTTRGSQAQFVICARDSLLELKSSFSKVN